MHVIQYRNTYADVPGENWWVLMALGVIMVVLGIVAISVPLFTALAVTTMIGFVLVIAGVAMTIGSFHLRATDSFWTTLLTGILSLIIGILLLANPVVAVLALTLMLSVLFFVGGLFKVAAGLTASLPNRGWLLLGGVLSLILGVLVAAQWPSSAMWLIGLYVGIDLIYMGFLMMQTASLIHHVRRDETLRTT